MGNGDYDYIVVGSGAGGGPLAANLARAGFTVLLMEAGSDSCAADEMGRWMYEVPIFHGLSTEYSGCQWDYFVRHYANTELQRRDSKFVEKDPASGQPVDGIWYPRAGTLGGCTAHNAMITVTPQNCDWNGIADLTGDASWRAGSMNKYFARLENCQYVPRPGTVRYTVNGLLWSFLALLRLQKDWRDWAHGHGFGGWLTTTEADPLLVLKDHEIVPTLINAAKVALESGIEHPLVSVLTKLDPNDTRNGVDMREGLTFTPLAVAAAKRNGPRDYLLRMKLEHPNDLTIQLHSLASRILFEDKRAIGVEFLEGEHLYEADPDARKTNGASKYETRQVFAKCEVIVSGGAFNSPQLLKLSGVGPRDELERLGIDVVADLPGVGENLQDRYEVGVVAEFPKPFVLLQGATFDPPKPGGPEDPCFKMWEGGKGIYATNGSLIGIIKRSDRSKPEPDLYIFGLPGYFKGYVPGYSALFERTKNRFTWAILKAYTENTAGRVTLQSKDPRKWPRVDFHYFSEGNDRKQSDLNAVVKGVQFVRRMNTALKMDREIVPGPGYQSEDNLQEFIQDEAWGHHASCTNKIGSERDRMAVLDSRFRVRGVKGLRVVDASVFPRIPGYFIVSAVYMISEKAFDVISEDAG
jgi:choline dehydrogenase